MGIFGETAEEKSVYTEGALITAHAEIEKLKRIIAKELTENDELGAEFVYVAVLKARIYELETQVKNSFWEFRRIETADWDIHQVRLAAQAMSNRLNSFLDHL